MATFPGAVPSYNGFTSSHTLAQDSHAAQSNAEQADIAAIATKVGTGASTPSQNTVLRGNGTGTTNYDTVHLATDVSGVLAVSNGGNGTTSTTGTGSVVFSNSPTLTTPTLTSPTVSGETSSNPIITGTVAGSATYTTPTLTQPTVGDFTNANHTHASTAQGGLLTGAALQLSAASNNIVYNGGGSTTYTITNSYANVTGLTVPSISFAAAGVALVFGTVNIQQTTGASLDLFFKVLMDGSTAPNYPTAGEIKITVSSATSNNRHSAAVMFLFTGISAGTHTFTAQANASIASDSVIDNTHTNLIVLPLSS